MRKISDILKQWKYESKAEGILQFHYSYSTGILTLCTSYPGWFIGRAGILIDKYRNVLKSEINGFTEINFIETNSWYIK